eukprot:g19280.t1
MSFQQALTPGVPRPEFGEGGSPAGMTSSEAKRRPNAELLKKKARRALKHAAAFLSLGLLLELAATFWTLAQAVASGVFDEADCGVRALALYHNERLPQNCQELDSSVVWFDEARTFNTFTACDGVEDPKIEQLCDCSRFDKVSSGCAWAPASSTRPDIEGLCVAVPVIQLSSDLQELYGTTYDWLLDSSELEFQKDCRPLTPAGFGDITIALVAVSLIIGLVEAYVGYKRWRNPLQGARLVVAASVVEGLGVLSIWGLLVFAPQGIVRSQADEAQVSENQYRFLQTMIGLVAVVTVAGTLAEFVFHRSAKAHDRLPYLGVFGNALVWLGSAITEVLVTAYLVWRLQFWKNQEAAEEEEENWPVLVAAVIGLVVLEIVALLSVWVARFFFARATTVLFKDMQIMEKLNVDVLDFLDCAALNDDPGPVGGGSSSMTRWARGDEAECPGRASRCHSRQEVSSATRRPSGQQPKCCTTGMIKTRSPRKPAANRFFFADGYTDGDPDGQAFSPVLREAEAAYHAAAASPVATDSAKARAQTTVAITEAMAALLSMARSAINSVHPPNLNEEVKHQHRQKGTVGISTQPVRRASSISSSKSLGHGHHQRSATTARIAALAARSRFSSDVESHIDEGHSGDLDEPEARESDDDSGSLGDKQTGIAAAAPGFSSINSGYSSEQGRRDGNPALEALAESIWRSSDWTVTTSINTPSAEKNTATSATTITVTATSARSALLEHASVAASYYSGRAVRLPVPALPGSPRSTPSSRTTADAGDDCNGEEKLDLLSDFSDSDQSKITNMASVAAGSLASGVGGVAPLGNLGCEVSYATSSSVSSESYPQEEGEDEGVVSMGSSGSDATPATAGGGDGEDDDFESLWSISSSPHRRWETSATASSHPGGAEVRSRNQDPMDFNCSSVVEALVSGARSMDRLVRFRRGWSHLDHDDEAEIYQNGSPGVGSVEQDVCSAHSVDTPQTPIAKTYVSTHLSYLRLSPDGTTVIVHRPEDGVKLYDFALGDILKVKEDVSAETVTLIRSDMKLVISFEGQPMALRKFSSMLLLPLPPQPPANAVPMDGKREHGEGVASRAVVEDGSKEKQKEEYDEGPIGHPERLSPAPRSPSSSNFAASGQSQSRVPPTTTLSPDRTTAANNSGQEALPPVNRDSGGGRATARRRATGDGDDGGGVGPPAAALFDSGAGGGTFLSASSHEFGGFSSLVVVEAAADKAQAWWKGWW